MPCLYICLLCVTLLSPIVTPQWASILCKRHEAPWSDLYFIYLLFVRQNFVYSWASLELAVPVTMTLNLWHSCLHGWNNRPVLWNPGYTALGMGLAAFCRLRTHLTTLSCPTSPSVTNLITVGHTCFSSISLLHCSKGSPLCKSFITYMLSHLQNQEGCFFFFFFLF